MKSFLNANEAKSRSYEALDNFIKEEFDKVHDQIIQAVEAGDFSTLWKTSDYMETKHIIRIIELLTCNDFVIYNEKGRCVSLNYLRSIENIKNFNIKWDISVEEAERKEILIRRKESYVGW